MTTRTTTASKNCYDCKMPGGLVPHTDVLCCCAILTEQSQNSFAQRLGVHYVALESYPTKILIPVQVCSLRGDAKQLRVVGGRSTVVPAAFIQLSGKGQGGGRSPGIPGFRFGMFGSNGYHLFFHLLDRNHSRCPP